MKRTPPIKDILWMIELGYSDNKIAKKTGAARDTVRKVRAVAVENDEMKKYDLACSNEELYRTLFPLANQRAKKVKPNMSVYTEQLLAGIEYAKVYEIYKSDCKKQQNHPLSFKRFCHYCKELKNALSNTYNKDICAGERAVVLWLKEPLYYADENGEKVRCYGFFGILPYSKYAFIKVFDARTVENWIRGNIEMVEHFGGVPKEIYASLHRYSSLNGDLQPKYREFASYYRILVLLNRDEQYSDEVRDVVVWLSMQMKTSICRSFEELQKMAEGVLKRYANKNLYGKGTVNELFNNGEAKLLRPLPLQAFVPDRKSHKILINSHIKHENVYYSVPFKYLLTEDKRVEYEILGNKISIYYHSECIAEHPYIQNGKGYMTHLCDMPTPDEEKLLDWNSNTLLSWAGRIGKNTKTVIKAVLDSKEIVQQAYLHCMTILGFEKKYSAEVLEWACAHVSEIPSGPMFQRIEKLIQNRTS